MKVTTYLSVVAACVSGFGTAQSTTSSGTQAAPTVDLGYVKYVGVKNATVNVISYFGVRYAAVRTHSTLLYRNSY